MKESLPLLLVRLDRVEATFVNDETKVKAKVPRDEWRRMGRPELVSIRAWPQGETA